MAVLNALRLNTKMTVGWPAREVKAWLRQLDEQRHARRQ
jgi:hypothetical protein